MAEALTEVAAADWDTRLDALGITDAYLRRDYLRASATLTPAQPTLLHLAGGGGDVVFACLVRTDPVDVITPYGYGGPVAVGAHPPVDAFATAYEGWCRARGAVSTFVLYHPLFANQTLDLPAFHRTPLNDTVSWPLEGDLLAGMHRHHRRMVRRAQAAGLQVRIEESPPTLHTFAALYTETMHRAGADAFYLFETDYWAALSEVPTVLVEVWGDGERVAANLGLIGAPWLHYHLGASSEAGRGRGANHLAMYALAGWGQARGYTQLHLGGGVGGRRDSLFEYKQRFAPGHERAAALGKAVHDPARYRELTGQAQVSYEGFFPAYRAPH